MSTPDVTKAQLVALVQAVLAVLVAFGVPLTELQQAALIGLAGALALVLVIADAAIRRGRAQHLGGLPAPPPSRQRPVSAQLDAIDREAEFERSAARVNDAREAPQEPPGRPEPAAADE